MRFTTLDSIVRRVLLAKRLPLHYYVEFLTHASSALRELTIDSLQVINTVTCTPNDIFAIDLPCDFLDDVAVGIPVGQYIQPIAKRDNINPLIDRNSFGQPQLYPTIDPNQDSTLFFGFFPGLTWFWNINDLGEGTGRLFGLNSGNTRNGYTLVRARNQIQLTQTFTSSEVVLQYISDGQCIDNATQITPMAQAAIEAYINWKRSKNADVDMSAEGLSWRNQRKILRARIDDLTGPDIKQIMYRNYHQTIKN